MILTPCRVIRIVYTLSMVEGIRLERDDEDHSTSSIALIREKEDTVVLIQSAWVTMAKMAKL